RYKENKRAVEDKHMGPLIKTIMTRCIHCTRCVRFSTEVAGVTDMGLIGRGENAEIVTYLDQAVSSELSGNVIDLCPVGALTSKPYAFAARPWELKKTESVDVSDAQGCAIRVDSRGPEVMRVLPRLNEDVNEEWISDKTRYCVDGLKRQRLDQPYVRVKGKLQPATWPEAFAAVAKAIKGKQGSEIAAIAGDLADCESMLVLKELMVGLGSTNMDCRQDGSKVDPAQRASYIFNSTIAGIEDADALLIVGANPRWEAPVLNARIRKRYLMGKFPIAAIGPAIDLSYPVDWLGEDADILAQIAAGTHPFAEILKTAERPMIIVGSGAVARPDGAAVLGLARQAADAAGAVTADWNGFNVLQRAASRVGGLDLGFVPGEGGMDTGRILDGAATGAVKVIYLLGADEIDTKDLDKPFVIYQGHHGDAGAHVADVILPGAAYTEKDATYVNLEGRVQRGQLAVYPPGDAREDWKIIRALSDTLNATLPYTTLADVRRGLVKANPVFQGIDDIQAAPWGEFGTTGEVSGAFTYPIANFYMTDPISRASATMAECTDEILGGGEGKTGTDG
ncbi:MAG TPA: NADH-quinone oxidoreductase subunit G, partial [Rhodospirillaceae bacterium]|nr:NADH-quinone oxidoreductase subunit G [Rhodospirillaceae bacterium]